MKRILMALGVILWVGALSPEIFMKSGGGCIFDENGEALTHLWRSISLRTAARRHRKR